MNRYTTFTFLFFTLCLLNPAHAQIEFVYGIKERIYIQDGDEVPSTPFRWNFGAGVDGGDNISGGSLTHPGGSESLSGEIGEFGTEGNDFQSQEALDAEFPSGNYSVNVTIDGSVQLLGPFDLSGDGYPPAPRILNTGDLDTHDFSDPFTLSWNPFTGYDADDRIVLEMQNVTTGEDLFFEFLPPDATSYEMPGGTFAEESQYELSILFVNETDGLESPETIIGYISRTNLTLSTISSDTRLTFFKFLRYEQTGPDNLQDRGYLSSASVIGVSNQVTHAQVNTESGFHPLDNPVNNVHFLSTLWDDKESLDAAYPWGQIQFSLEENGSSAPYAPYYFPPDAYPAPAVIQNFSELEKLDAGQNRAVSWSAAPEGVTLIRVRITTGLNQEVWSMELDPSATSVEIPADTLEYYNDYTLAVAFWSEQTGSEFPDASLGYATSTFMAIQTVATDIDFAGWTMLVFPEEQLGNPEITGEDADPDGDKLSNYLEFLLGANPTDPNSGLTYRVVGTTLIISPISGGVTWELRSSGDLANWSPLGAEFYEVLDDAIRIDLGAFPGDAFIQLVFFDDL